MNAKRILVLFTICMVTLLLRAQESTQNYLSEKRYLDANATSSVHTVNYHDGLGRPYLTVMEDLQGTTGSLQKQYTWQRYDEQGRVSRTYLPYAVSNSYHSLVNVNALSSLYNDSKAYVDYNYENRSDGRIISVQGPGSAWDNRAQTTSYLTNTTTSGSPLHCKRYTLNSDYSLSSGNYTAGSLSVVQYTDEDGNTAYTFTDRQGRTILERVMNGVEEKLDTYYVYDTFGNLCYVLQPMYQTDADLSKYAYRYRYDEYNRCIEKKLPGTEPIMYVYDKVGHLTYSQDSKQASEGKYTFYLYDRHNRLAVQGEIKRSLPPLVVNQAVTAELIESDLLVIGQIPGTRYCSTLILSNVTLHQVNYYDNYDFRSLDGFRNMSLELNLVDRPGKLTGSQTADLSSEGGFRYTQYFYNAKGELQRQVCRYPDEYIETRTYTYSFTGQPLQETVNLGSDGLTLLDSKTYADYEYQYSYDALDRCSRIDMVQGGNTVTLVTYTYDGVGRMTAQAFHNGTAGTMSYGYNVRGWTTSIGSTGNKFTQALTYNNGTKGFNGNITAMNWTANGQSHAYTFTYDGANRLLNATHGNNRYTEKVTEYDRNGNIKKLQRYGQTGASSYGLVDNLTYTYNGNKVTRVDDATTATSYTGGTNFINGASTNNEYTYDNNGNLTKDLNKNITNIQYNSLNLPNEVLFDNGATQTYRYMADGTKWRVVYTVGMLQKDTLDYCGGAIVENGVLKKLLTPVGYVDMSGTTPSYYYYLKDHQGNNRVVINSSGAVQETNHYYPFGGLFATNGSVQDYKYNGKEFDPKGGLNLYDYGARHYDAALGRFTTIDPLAEKHYSNTSYMYCLNNPLIYIDPLGKDTVLVRDINTRPNDIGMKGQSYTAKVDVIQNGTIVGTYRGSSYPNSNSNLDNNTKWNTINEGEYPLNNKFGHAKGTQKGLNIVNEDGERVAPGKTPQGADVRMINVNVHSGKSDYGNYNSRGSHGCITIHPEDSEAFFSNFTWDQENPNIGNFEGKIIILRNIENK